MLPDLRNPDPLRTEVTPDTIALSDIVAHLKKINDAIVRFEHSAESIAATAIMVEVDIMVDKLKDFKGRVYGVRWGLTHKQGMDGDRVLRAKAREEKARRKEENRREWLRLREEGYQRRQQMRAEARDKKRMEAINKRERIADLKMSERLQSRP